MSWRMRLAAGVVSWAWSASALADVHYVSETGGDVYPYTSPEDAARDMHDALGAAEAGDTVQVLPGTYCSSADRPYTLKNDVRLAGSGPGRTSIVGLLRTGDGARIRGFRFGGTGVSLLSDGLWRSNAEVANCVFDGVGLGVSGIEADVRVTHCVFRNVPAGRCAVYAMYSGVTIEDCVFDLAERAADGMFFDDLPTPAVIRNCRFTGCRWAIAVGSGGDTLIANCLFRDNDAAISAWGRPFRAENCTFYRNGCAVLTVLDLDEEVISNSIIWGNNAGIVEYYSRRDYFDSTWKEERAMPLISFSALQTNVWWTYPGRRNINADPNFFSPEFDPDLHLYAGSPCIDAGDPFSDFSNEPEPNGGRVNMGTYGNTWEATTSELADTDGDNLRDDWEVENFANLDRDGSGDADDDGLNDREEYRHLSDPNNPDSDGDGLRDGEEVFDLGTDPILADTDNDGTPDGKEAAQGTNPLDPWDAFAIIKFWIENDQIHVVHPVQPRCWYELQSSFFPGGPFGIVCPIWEGRFGVPAHTFVVDLSPYARFYRIEARPF